MASDALNIALGLETFNCFRFFSSILLTFTGTPLRKLVGILRPRSQCPHCSLFQTNNLLKKNLKIKIN